MIYKIHLPLIFILVLFSFSQGQHQVRQIGENSSNIGFGFLSGDKVESGFSLYYSFLSSEEESQLETGYGFAINYFDVLNLDDGYKGHFFSYSPQLVANYYLNNGPFKLQLSGTILLVFGSESINNTTTNFFIGPQFREAIGLMIANTMCLKAGLFQLRHFGSDVLPSDIGSFFGLDFSF